MTQLILNKYAQQNPNTALLLDSAQKAITKSVDTAEDTVGADDTSSTSKVDKQLPSLDNYSMDEKSARDTLISQGFSDTDYVNARDTLEHLTMPALDIPGFIKEVADIAVNSG